MKKRIFLTGASSGIGRATAQLLVREGHQVWGTSRDPERVPALSGLHAVRLDLSDTASIGECFAGAEREAGGFDVVINNAGSGHFSASEFMTAELMTEQFQLLVFAPVELCRLALASMRPRGSGLIINVSSLASRLPVPFMAAYNAAKAALASFTMTAQLELQGSAIRMIDLQPADIFTNFNDVVQRASVAGSPYQRALEQTWEVVDKNLRSAPKPELVARRIAALINQKNPPPRVTVGDRFQAIVAPAIFGLLSQRMRIWALRNYYKL